MGNAANLGMDWFRNCPGGIQRSPMDPRQSITAEGVSALQGAVRRIERLPALDGLSGRIGRVLGPVSNGRAGRALRGDWLGHSLHPPMTDIALGCWLGASLLDVLAGETSERAATTLVGAGLVSAIPTVLSGAAEWPSLQDRSSRRVAVVHAVGNAAVIACYTTSWLLRRSGRGKAGMAWGLAGGTLGLLTGYLGGHLAFGRRVGVGERWTGAPDHQTDGIDADRTAADGEKRY